MSELPNVILNLTSQEIGEELQTALGVNNYVVVTKETLTSEQQIALILIDDSSGPLQSLESAYFVSEKNIAVLRLTMPGDVDVYFSSAAHGWIDSSHLNHAVCRTLFQRFLTNHGSTRFEGTFGAIAESMQYFKVSNHLSHGHYADVLAIEAHKGGANPIQMRSAVVDVMTYFSYLQSAGVVRYPFEVSHGGSEDIYIVQISVHAEQFVLEHIKDAFRNKPDASPFHHLFRRFHAMTMLTDVFYLKRSKTVSMTLCWPKNGISKTSSLLLNNIESFAASERRWRGFKNAPEIQQLHDKKQQDEFLQVPLPGELPKVFALSGINQSAARGLGRLVDYARQKWQASDNAQPLEEISVEIVRGWLEDYPNKLAVKNLEEEQLQQIVQLLGEEGPVKRSDDQARKQSEWRQKLIENVMNRVRGMELEEVNEFVRVKGRFDEDKTIFRIAGSKEDIGDEHVMIKGSGESNRQDEKIIVPDLLKVVSRGDGQYSEQDHEAWAEARSEMADDLAKKLQEINLDEADNIDAILEEQLEAVLLEKTGVEGTISTIIAKEVLSDGAEEADIDFANANTGLTRGPINGVIENQDREIQKLKKQLKGREDQLERMRTLMSQLKVRVDSLAGEQGNGQGQRLKQENQKLLEVIAEKDAKLEELINGQGDRSGNRDEYIAKLLSEIDELKNRRTVKSDNNDELRTTQKNYKTLQKENELLRLRFQALNEKFDKQKLEMQKSRSDDLMQLNETKEMSNMQVERLTRELNRLRQQEDYLTTEIQEKDREISDLKKHPVAHTGKEAQHAVQDAFKQSLMEKDLAITKLNVELKSIHEQNEQMQLQVKQLENKLKLAQGQKSSNMADVAAQQSKQATQDGKMNQMQHRMKQQEKLFAKMEEAQKKLMADLAEKKKESHTLRQENSILKNKVTEMERKMGPHKKTG